MRACSHCFTLKYGCVKVRGMRIYTYSIPYKTIDLPLHHLTNDMLSSIYTYSLIHSSNMMERRCIEKNEKRSPFICLHWHHGSHKISRQKHPALGSAAVVVAADIAGSYTPMPSGQTFSPTKKNEDPSWFKFLFTNSQTRMKTNCWTLWKKMCLSWFK